MSEVDRQFRLARRWSNVELSRLAPLFGGDVVNVSAGEDRDKEGRTYGDYFSAKKTYSLTNHSPGSFRGYQGRENEYLLDLSLPLDPTLTRRFDVVFNHTTLEHIFEVRRAFANLCEMSRDVVIIIVPFAQVEHESASFGDYWRFTPRCIRCMFKENQFDVIYESVNDDFNAAVYLLFVGSRNATKWAGLMPAWEPVHHAAKWIGGKNECAIDAGGSAWRQFKRRVSRVLGMNSER